MNTEVPLSVRTPSLLSDYLRARRREITPEEGGIQRVKSRQGYSVDRTRMIRHERAAASGRSGMHYPRSAGEFRSWFATDADCLDYLD